MESVKPYKKAFDYSYTLGAFPTFEMLNTMPKTVRQVLVHSSFTEKEKINEICSKHRIPVFENDKLIAKLSDKENVFVVGIFEKFNKILADDKSHMVFVNPGNMGNLGTNLRTAVAFGIKNIALINPAPDIFNPKVIRASMGAVFRLNFQYFDTFEEYRKAYPRHEIFTFMLNAKEQLTVDNCPKPELFSLVFGNEASGLPDEFLEVGKSIIIPQSDEVDSLNITIAVGIGAYMFSSGNI